MKMVISGVISALVFLSCIVALLMLFGQNATVGTLGGIVIFFGSLYLACTVFEKINEYWRA